MWVPSLSTELPGPFVYATAFPIVGELLICEYSIIISVLRPETRIQAGNRGLQTQIRAFIWYRRTRLKYMGQVAVRMTDDTERTSVRTYVPAYQKELWRDHADELGMSQSEYVRTMVQAGRSGFEPPEATSQTGVDETASSVEDRSPDATPGVDGLEDRVLGVLADGDHYDWDALLAALTDDIEQRLDETLQELQSADRVRYSGRNGGYVLDE